MNFEEQYPNKPPGVKFISQMFHPNVYGTGELCLDILQNRWSPTYDVAAILTSIQRYGAHIPWCMFSIIDEDANLHVFLVCSTTPTPRLPPMWKRRTSTKTTARNMSKGCGRPLKRAGRISRRGEIWSFGWNHSIEG